MVFGCSDLEDITKNYKQCVFKITILFLTVHRASHNVIVNDILPSFPCHLGRFLISSILSKNIKAQNDIDVYFIIWRNSNKVSFKKLLVSFNYKKESFSTNDWLEISNLQIMTTNDSNSRYS